MKSEEEEGREENGRNSIGGEEEHVVEVKREWVGGRCEDEE